MSWQHADRVWVKSGGTWRSSDNVYVKSGGIMEGCCTV